MSGGLDVLQMKEDDVTKMLAAATHLGDANIDYQMAQYVFKVKADGVPIIQLRKTWEKLLLAARVVASIENPTDVCVLSHKQFGQRAILKFSHYTGANAIAGRFTPGTFTNQIQAAFREPRLLIISDPRTDQQPITEAAYVNIPVIAFCNTNSSLRHIDIAIPCNNMGKNSVGLMWWFLCREVLRLRGTISRDLPWEVMSDLFFYREPEDIEKDEQAKQDAADERDQWTNLGTKDTAEVPTTEQWIDTAGDWAAETVPGGAPPIVPAPAGQPTTVPPFAAGGGGGGGTAATAAAAGGGTGDQDWNVAQTTGTTKDWGADESDWVNAEPKATGGNW